LILLVGGPYWLIAPFVHDVLIPAWRGDPPEVPGRPEPAREQDEPADH
jgi:hypothetical protein